MQKSKEPVSDSWRILLFAQNATELFLTRSPSGLRLPEFRIPRRQRAAVSLNAQAKRLWKLDTVSLSPLEVQTPEAAANRHKYHTMEVYRPEHPALVARNFLPVSGLQKKTFADQNDFLAVRQAMRWHDGAVGERNPGPFSEVGFFQTLCGWVQAQLGPLGLRWEGNFYQLHANASFALIRFQLERGAVWFKAVGPANLKEFFITTTLAARFPEYLPELLATHDGWHAWLAREVEGETLLRDSHMTRWRNAAAALSQLQIASVSAIDELLAAGARDLRIHKLQEQCDPFFRVVENLMGRQTKTCPPPLSSAALCQLRKHVSAALAELKSLQIPDALVHLDCSPANIVVSSGTCRFLDWAEAGIGNPFLNLQYLLEYFRSAHGPNSRAETALTRSYITAWKSSLGPLAMATALRLAPTVAVFAYAATFAANRRLEAPQTAPCLRSLARRLHKEMRAQFVREIAR